MLRALRGLGLEGIEICVEELGAWRDAISAAPLVFELTDTYRGSGELRAVVRHTVEAWGGRLAGSPASAAHVSDDKVESGKRLLAAGLRVPASSVVSDPAELCRAAFPAVLKRPFEHGSRGVLLVENAAQASRAFKTWRSKGEHAILVEEFVEGRELAVSVLETAGGPEALPIVEVQLRERTYSERAKWGRGPLPICEAQLSRSETKRIEGAALRAFRVLGLRDCGRFDIRLPGDGIPCFLEANARPSIEDGTELRLSGELAGLDLEALVATIMENAARRHGDGRLEHLAQGLRKRHRS